MGFLRKVESPVQPMSLTEVNLALRSEINELKAELDKTRSDLNKSETTNKILTDTVKSQGENLVTLALGNATAMTQLGNRIADLDATGKSNEQKLIEKTKLTEESERKISELSSNLEAASSTASKLGRTIGRQRRVIYILGTIALMGVAYFLMANWKVIATFSIYILQKLVGG